MRTLASLQPNGRPPGPAWLTCYNARNPALQSTARRAVLAAKEEAVWRYTQALADAVHLYKTDRERALRIIGEYSQVEDRGALASATDVMSNE